MTQTKISHQIGGIEITLRRRDLLAHLQESLDSVARRTHSRANTWKQRTIRFANITDTSHELGTRRLERQLVAQRVDFVEIEVGSRPPRQPACAASHVWRHMRITVAVAADPRSESQRSGI